MKFIGEGTFTRAYLIRAGVVLLKSTDRVKDIMAAGLFPNHSMFPKLKLTGIYRTHREYEMDRYIVHEDPMQYLNKRQKRFYRALMGTFPAAYPNFLRKDWDEYNTAPLWWNVFESLPDEFKTEKEALIQAVNALLVFGNSIRFESNPKNVAVKDGKLILLDGFFFHNDICETTRYT